MKQRAKFKKRYVTPKECPFCSSKSTPDYKEYKRLVEFLTARSAIMPQKYSGVCSAHQRALGREIKRSRHLGLLPFLPSV